MLPPFSRAEFAQFLADHASDRMAGSKRDSLILTDAAINAGTSLLSSPSHSFKAKDINKYVTVRGAGSSGGDLTAQILSTGSGNATLSLNAGTTVTAAFAQFGSDDSAAFNELLAAIPKQGRELRIPYGCYTIAQPLTVAALQSIRLIGGGFSDFPTEAGTPGHGQGVILHNATGGLLFNLPTALQGIKDVMFEIAGVTIWGGTGVLQTPDQATNLNLYIHDSVVMFCSGAAFELGATDGGDPTNGNAYFNRFSRMKFYFCGTGILQHPNCDLWVNESYFWGNNRSLDLGGANAKIYANGFQTEIGNTGTEEIKIRPNSGVPTSGGTNNIEITGNKFGNEAIVPGDATRVKIRVGDAVIKAANPTYYAIGLNIHHNYFYGTYPYPTPGASPNPTACIALHSPLSYSNISNNIYQDALYFIDDSGMDESDLATGNFCQDNVDIFATTLLFRSGGKGFNFIRANGMLAQPPSVRDTMLIENLIAQSEDFAATWGPFLCTVTSGQTDPFGTTRAYLLTKTGGPYPYLGIGFTPSTNGACVFSLWAKAGTLNLLTIDIYNPTTMATISRQSVWLDGVWRRYYVRCTNQTAGFAQAVRIYPGQLSDSITGTVYIFGSQINTGDEPSGYVQTTGSTVTGNTGLSIPADLYFQGVVRNPLWQILHNFAALVLTEATSGKAFRWTLNNDHTLRLQYSTDGFVTTQPICEIQDVTNWIVSIPLELDNDLKLFSGSLASSRPLKLDGGKKVISQTIDGTSTSDFNIPTGTVPSGYVLVNNAGVIGSGGGAPLHFAAGVADGDMCMAHPSTGEIQTMNQAAACSWLGFSVGHTHQYTAPSSHNHGGVTTGSGSTSSASGGSTSNTGGPI